MFQAHGPIVRVKAVTVKVVVVPAEPVQLIGIVNVFAVTTVTVWVPTMVALDPLLVAITMLSPVASPCDAAVTTVGFAAVLDWIAIGPCGRASDSRKKPS